MLSKKEKINITRKVRLIGDLHNPDIWEVIAERPKNSYIIRRKNSKGIIEERREHLRAIGPVWDKGDRLEIDKITLKRKNEPLGVSLLRLLFTS